VVQKLFLLSLAGAMGTLARYGLSGLVQHHAGSGFPWGTAAVNLVGCFVAGLLWSLFEFRLHLGGEVRTIVFIGFMGAFTTFSSFALETSALMRDAEWLRAAANILLQNGIGLAAIFAGLAAGRAA